MCLVHARGECPLLCCGGKFPTCPIQDKLETCPHKRGLANECRPADLPGAPVIDRVTSVPVFGADESLLTTPGYHAGARTYYAPPAGQCDLDRMRRLLKSLINECSAGKRPRSCPIIATLSRSGAHASPRAG